MTPAEHADAILGILARLQTPCGIPYTSVCARATKVVGAYPRNGYHGPILHVCDALGDLKARGLVRALDVGTCTATWVATDEGKRIVRQARAEAALRKGAS